MRRGEIRWYTFSSPDKRRPVLLLTRDQVIEQLDQVIVVPATRTIRGISTEVLLSADDGMPTTCALNLDHLGIVRRSRIDSLLAALPDSRWPEVERALLAACGFGPSR